jgi:GntR family transcriptional regulator/MocR family aminotransferase
MSKHGNSGVLANLSVPTSPTPIYRRIFNELRGGIINGRFPPGTRLPATRVLASELEVSRNTILHVFEDLFSEGYLESRVGDGTYVAKTLPEDHLLPRKAPALSAKLPRGNTPPRGNDHIALSARGRLLAELAVTTAPTVTKTFSPDIPAFDSFPLDTWGNMMAQSWRESQPNVFCRQHVW